MDDGNAREAATETWGVRALGIHLEERFDLQQEFIDMPTGL